MAMKLRLARKGCKNRAYYWIMAADARAPRCTGKEKVGTYDPLKSKEDPLRVVLKSDRIQHWLKCGAQPTQTVRRFLSKAGLMAPQVFPPKKTAPAQKEASSS
jgi:small subunit ribosomal protein S16